MGDTALAWFRRDLRLHDNRALVEACEADRLLPVYVFDPRDYGEADFGGTDSFRYRKTGARRARFRLESVASLRERLRERDSELVIRRGRPADELADLAERVGADAVYHHTRPTAEERDAENAVARTLRDRGLAVHAFWGHTLYHPNDLPTPVTAISDTFTEFDRDTAREATVRAPHRTPPLPPAPAVADPGEVGGVSDLPGDLATPTFDDRAVMRFEGGEVAARERLERWMWNRDGPQDYAETRNGLVGAEYSSKLSPWLSEGCLSPRYVRAELDRYEDRRVANDSTAKLAYELRWRDFFAFQFAKHRRSFWRPGGIRERTDIDWRGGSTALRRWKRGETGIPFVDANMRELDRTGYLSNRGRQVVASFLANDLRVDWRRGAAHFETHLLDYDPCSNYGNWAYVAGVGNDSRERAFDVLGQARRYDPEAAYVTRWLPALRGLPPEAAHEPWTLTQAQREAYDLELGVDYPEPMVDPETLGN